MSAAVPAVAGKRMTPPLIVIGSCVICPVMARYQVVSAGSEPGGSIDASCNAVSARGCAIQADEMNIRRQVAAQLLRALRIRRIEDEYGGLCVGQDAGLLGGRKTVIQPETDESSQRGSAVELKIFRAVARQHRDPVLAFATERSQCVDQLLDADEKLAMGDGTAFEQQRRLAAEAACISLDHVAEDPGLASPQLAIKSAVPVRPVLRDAVNAAARKPSLQHARTE